MTLPNYDNWLQEPYMEQFAVDDFPQYERYLQEWYEGHRPEYSDYCEDTVADGDTPMSFGEWIKDCGYEPQDVHDFAQEWNEAMYEDEMERRAEMRKDEL